MRRLFIDQLDDVITKLALYQSAELTFVLQGECGLFELRNHCAASESRQFTTLCRTSRIVRVLLGELLEIAAILNLLQQAFRLCLRRIQCLLIALTVSSLRCSLHQDVAHVNALWKLVLLGMLVVVALDLVVTNTHSGNARCADRDIPRFTLFRD